MIKDELMIGNYIECENLRPVIITGIHNSFCYYSFKDIHNSATWNFCKPIQLTEEWLLRLGFEKFHGSFKKGNHYFHLNVWYFEGEYEIFNPNYDIQFVHQLQNLYFALTGEKLKLKE